MSTNAIYTRFNNTVKNMLFWLHVPGTFFDVSYPFNLSVIIYYIKCRVMRIKISMCRVYMHACIAWRVKTLCVIKMSKISHCLVDQGINHIMQVWNIGGKGLAQNLTKSVLFKKTGILELRKRSRWLVFFPSHLRKQLIQIRSPLSWYTFIYATSN